LDWRPLRNGLACSSEQKDPDDFFAVRNRTALQPIRCVQYGQLWVD